MVDSAEDFGESDSENEAEYKHVRLLRSINALDSKKQLLEKKEDSARANEFNAVSFNDKVKFHEVVGALSETKTFGDLKKKLRRVSQKKAISAPLHKHEKDQIQREIAYEKVKKDIKPWDSVVEENRKAEQIHFPLVELSKLAPNSSDHLKKFQPSSEMEQEIANILDKSGTTLSEGEVLTPLEKRAIEAMSLAEAKARRAELQKYRFLSSYQEEKARRQKKIKSKGFHKILRKEKLKKQVKDLEILKTTNPQQFLDELQKKEEIRIKERMSLKHKIGGKFIARQKVFGKYNPEARKLVREMLQKHAEETRKNLVCDPCGSPDINNTFDSNSNLNANSDSGIKNWLNEASTRNPWMNIQAPELSNSENSKATSINEKKRLKVSKKTTGKEQTKSKFKNQSNQSSKSVVESQTPPDESEEDQGQGVNLSLIRKQTLTDFNEFESASCEQCVEGSDASFHRQPANDLEKSSAKSKSDSSLRKDNTPVKSKRNKEVKKEVSITHSAQPSVVNDEDSAEEHEESEYTAATITIAEAFANDDVVGEFKKEKRKTAENEAPKDVNLTLPGWGEWAGANLTVSKKKKKRFTVKAPKKPRFDKNLNNVIISECRDTSINKHLVKELPYPFKNEKQFEAIIQAPIGKTWNPENSYHNLIKPAVVTKLGTIIKPINKQNTFKKQSIMKPNSFCS